MIDQIGNIVEDDDRFLTFSLSGIVYGVSIKNVIEIIGVGSITKVPGMPEYVIGVTNMRGQVIPVVDFRSRLNKPPRPYDDRTCIIVCTQSNMQVGFVVDRVQSVLEIKEGDIAAIPDGKLVSEGEFLLGLGRANGEIQLLVDIKKLF